MSVMQPLAVQEVSKPGIALNQFSSTLLSLSSEPHDRHRETCQSMPPPMVRISVASASRFRLGALRALEKQSQPGPLIRELRRAVAQGD
jgi:hypothetical protein